MNDVRAKIALFLSCLTVVLVATAGCGEDGVVNPTPQDPQHIAVRDLLVAFTGSAPGIDVDRTKAEAESMATSLYARARAGEDFGDLQETYSDSPSRDTLGIANYGVTPDSTENPRTSVLPGFGNVAFALQPDSIGLAPWDTVSCPHGWFLIQRVR